MRRHGKVSVELLARLVLLSRGVPVEEHWKPAHPDDVTPTTLSMAADVQDRETKPR